MPIEAEPGDERLLRSLVSASTILMLLLPILLPVCFGAGMCVEVNTSAVAPVWTGSEDEKSEEDSDSNGMKEGTPVCS